MHYNFMIGGAAGQGIDTMAAILVKMLKKEGYAVFTTHDFMSRVRGGHNFVLIRFGDSPVNSHSMVLDGLIALDEETINQHAAEVKKEGFILCDTHLETGDERVIRIPWVDLAKELGNPRVAGSIAIGAILKLFTLSAVEIKEILRQELPEKHVEINLEAFHNGYAQMEHRYEKLVADFTGHMLINGNRAVALGALAAGIKFYSAYPMSPSTGIMEFLAAHSKSLDVVVEQAEDEIAAINLALGASFTGVPSMTGTSGGGFSLMVEAIGLSGIAEIPIVIVDVQRPGPATGLPTRTEQGDLRFVIHAAQGEFPRKVIAVRHHEDAYRQTIRAFRIAEKYQIPVIILSDQYLADGIATLKPFVLPERVLESKPEADPGEYKRYALTDSGISPRFKPGEVDRLVVVDSDEHDEAGLITESAEVRKNMVDKRMRKLQGIVEELEEPEVIGSENGSVLLIGWGSTWGPIKEAVELLNRESPETYCALVFGDVFPLPEKRLIETAQGVKSIINIEQNATGQLAGLIREKTGLRCDHSILKYDGRQISGEEIVARIKEVSR